MFKSLLKCLSSLYLQVYFGNFLFFLQNDGTATPNSVTDVHLKQAEQWFRPQDISLVILCFHSEQEGKETPTGLIKLFGPVAWCRNGPSWLHQYLSYRSRECFLAKHCSSSLDQLPWIPGAWPHYNFHT